MRDGIIEEYKETTNSLRAAAVKQREIITRAVAESRGLTYKENTEYNLLAADINALHHKLDAIARRVTTSEPTKQCADCRRCKAYAPASEVEKRRALAAARHERQRRQHRRTMTIITVGVGIIFTAVFIGFTALVLDFIDVVNDANRGGNDMLYNEELREAADNEFYL